MGADDERMDLVQESQIKKTVSKSMISTSESKRNPNGGKVFLHV